MNNTMTEWKQRTTPTGTELTLDGQRCIVERIDDERRILWQHDGFRSWEGVEAIGWKYADPTETSRIVESESDLAEILSIDPSLVIDFRQVV